MATIDFVVKNGLVVTEEAQILGTTDSTGSTDTNASIYTAGGIAVAKKVFVGTDLAVGNDTTLTGDIAVNGGDITTTATTFNLINATATTVNFAGASTALTIGATTGTATIRNANVVLSGDLEVQGGDITTNQTTFNLIDTTATTVNFARAGTGITIGATTGTATIRNANVVLSGDLEVQGGDITTNQTTFNLINATATTVNFAGASTALTIGATTGTATVRNPTLTMSNGTTFNMNGSNPAISSTNTGTASIFNANITTINLGQAASISMGSTTGTVTARGNLSVNGNTVIGDASADTITFNSNTAITPNTLTFTIDDATNNGISYPVKIQHTTSGTPALGIGVGLDFVVETSNNNNRIGARIEALTTDVTNTSEDFDIVFKTMVNGATATQSLRLSNTTLTVGANATATTINTQPSSNLTVTTGAVTATANGSTATFIAGAGGSTSGAGGEAVFSGGNASTNGVGGTARLKSGAAVGTNLIGTDTIIEGGVGTGTGRAGNIIFRTGPGGASGSQQNPLSIVLTLTQTGLDVPGDVVISGDLIVNGTTTTVNSNVVTIDDKNIELGSVGAGTVSATGTVGSISGSGPWTATITNMAATAGLIPGSAITATNGTGSLGGGGTYIITSVINRNSVTFTATGGTTPTAGTITNIQTTGATNLTAEGGGLTLRGTTDKTFSWTSASAAWTSSENVNIVSGKAYEVNAVDVLTGTAVLLNAATASIGNTSGVATVNIGANNQNNILQIFGNGTGGTATLTTNVTTGTVNAFGAVTGTVNLGGNAATLSLGNSVTTAQTVNIGGASTAASTYNIGHGATANAVTKTINIGTNGASGSITNINIGSAVSGSTGTSTINGTTINLGTGNNAATTVTVGPGITGNILKLNSTTAGIANLTTDVTSGTVNLFTSVSTGTGNLFTGITTGSVNIGTGGASITNIGGAGGSLNVGATNGNSTLTIRGNTGTGIAALSTNVTTGTVNVFTGVTTGTVNIATGGGSVTNIGGNAASLNIGTVSGNSTLTIRGNGVGGTATIATNVTTGAINLFTSITTGTVTIGSANGGRLSIPFNQSSTTTTTGAVVITGGVGIGENLNVGGTLTVSSINNTPIGNITPSTGAFTTLTANAAVTFTQNTASTSTTTGTLVVTGGAGVSGAIYAGSIQNTPIGSTTRSSGAFTTLTANAAVTFTQNTASTSTTTGTLVVTGGVGVSENIHIGGALVKTVTGTTTAELIRGNMADSDQFRILIGGTASNAGYAEIATADDGTEPIYVRQYTGVFTTLQRTLTLLDGSGNTSIPGSLSVTSTLTVTGGIQNTPIGNTTRNTGAFTTLTANAAVTFTQNTASTSTTTGTLVVTGGVGVSGNIYTGGTIALTANSTRIQQNNTTTWSGDAGAGFGKLEYHSNRWYINAGSDSTEVVRFRRGASDIAWLTNAGALSLSSTLTVSGNNITMAASDSRDKYRVWSDSNYTIGMQNGYTFGAINNDYAMTFQMNNADNRGFWWGDAGHTNAQGAMSLSTNGKLTVAHSIRVGFGETDTTIPGAVHRLEVNGSFAATTKSFLIDHPTKPGKKLQHGSLEGPEHGVYIRGKLNGTVIELPEYWTNLVDPDSITVQLTPIGQSQSLYVDKIEDNIVYIKNENQDREPYCFYFIQAERTDVEKIEVEIG
jgi:hypothetical protein